jgi:hypothetical protein
MTIKGKGFDPNGGGFASLVINGEEVPCEVIESLRQQLDDADNRCELSYKVEIDLLNEIGKLLEPVEYRGSYAEGIRVLQRQLAECRALLDDADKVIRRQRDERLEAIKQAKREAFQAGYARGHNDTVEGCYNSNCDCENECADEWMAEETG